MAIGVDEWPDVICDEPEVHEEYSRLVEAAGEFTSAILDCQMKGLLVPTVNKSLQDYLKAVLSSLEKQ